MEDENIDLEVENLLEAEKESDSEVLKESDSEAQNSFTESSNPVAELKITTTNTLSKPVRHLRLPFSKVKQIMKMDPDVVIVQQDAAFLVTKATEMFIEYLTKETNKQLAGQKRKTLMKRDVDAAIESISQLCFLDGALE